MSGKPETRAFITIKGAPQGTTRPEFEYPIPLSDAEALMTLCLRPLIEKVRYVRGISRQALGGG